MSEFMFALAGILQFVFPDWVRLPNLTFELPHPVYWIGLAAFPLVAMFLLRRESGLRDRPRVTLPIAYLLWLCGGIAGLHRFYLRSGLIGFVYVALFVGVLYGNAHQSGALDELSDARNDQMIAEFELERQQESAGEDSPEAAQASENLEAVNEKLAVARSRVERWGALSGGLGAVIVLVLLLDAALMPRLRERCLRTERKEGLYGEPLVIERGVRRDERGEVHNPFTRLVDTVNGWIGEFIAYWSLIAVFVYYYEVLARYVFNSPTNWAHESMFLMFGMQYLLAGGFAYRDEAHVRVDVIYERFSTRARAAIDIVTSFFFFVFTLTILVTGIIFARDAIAVWEVSFTEWAIQYWPVKITIALGAFLLLLQGLARLSRDITYLARGKA